MDYMVRIHLALGANNEARLFSRVEVLLYISTSNSHYPTSLSAFDSELQILATLIEFLLVVIYNYLNISFYQDIIFGEVSVENISELLTGLLSYEFSEFSFYNLENNPLPNLFLYKIFTHPVSSLLVLLRGQRIWSSGISLREHSPIMSLDILYLPVSGNFQFCL